MGTFDKLVQGITETIKMNDKIVSLSEKIKDLSHEVRDIDHRLVRMETFVEIAQNKRLK
jgi:hypothetical protein